MKKLNIIGTVRLEEDKPLKKSVIETMLLKGIEIFRFNLSRFSSEAYLRDIDILRESALLLEKEIRIMLDIPLPGSKVRLGTIPDAGINVVDGEIIRFCSDLTAHLNPGFIPVRYTNIGSMVREGEVVIIGDGELRLKIHQIINADSFSAKALNSNCIRIGRAIVFEGISHKATSTRELQYYNAIIRKVLPDSVALSFVENADQLRQFSSEVLKPLQKKVCLISKIESPQGMKNLEQIAKHSDGLMVARGDLALSAPMEELGLNQQQIIDVARRHRKSVIIATQVLTSLYHEPMPSRPEIIDINQMIMQNVDGVVLSSGICAHPNFELAVNTINGINRAVRQKREEGFIRCSEQI